MESRKILREVEIFDREEETGVIKSREEHDRLVEIETESKEKERERKREEEIKTEREKEEEIKKKKGERGIS